MKKMFLGLVATTLFSVSGFANTQIVEEQTSVTIENNNEKFKVNYNLGNISELSEEEIITLCKNLTLPDFNNKDVDECTISLSAEVTVGFASITVSVSYTASNCETAMSKASAALASAVKKAKSVLANM